jgi:hypothetical protein
MNQWEWKMKSGEENKRENKGIPRKFPEYFYGKA